jgi:hypothetical protein
MRRAWRETSPDGRRSGGQVRGADWLQTAALKGRPAIEKSQDISGIHGGSEQNVIAQTTIEIVRQTISDDRFTAKAACYGKAT